MADENRMVTFDYASESFESYRRPDVSSGVTPTPECMTKSEFLATYEGDDSLLVDYQGNQLIPRGKCRSGYKCSEAFIRSRTYPSYIGTHVIKISVKGTGVFPVSINVSPYRNFSITIYDNSNNVVKIVNNVNSTLALFKVPKTTNTLDEFTLVISNKTNPLFTVPAYPQFQYCFGCAVNDSQSGMIVPSKLYIRENGIAIPTMTFVINTNPGNFPNIAWNNSGNPLQFVNSKLGSIYYNSNENVGVYQNSANGTNNYGAPSGTTFDNYYFTFLGTVQISVQYVGSNWYESV